MQSVPKYLEIVKSNTIKHRDNVCHVSTFVQKCQLMQVAVGS